jgi:hypothetical protein
MAQGKHKQEPSLIGLQHLKIIFFHPISFYALNSEQSRIVKLKEDICLNALSRIALSEKSSNVSTENTSVSRQARNQNFSD